MNYLNEVDQMKQDLWELYRFVNEDNENLELIVRLVRNLYSIHFDESYRRKNSSCRANKWIPTAKKEPERQGRYLALVKGQDFIEKEQEYYEYELLYYAPAGISSNSKFKWWSSEYGEEYDNEEVLAWRPLPKPYKGVDAG